ncbi:MAG: hypothetical protein R2787_12850 [Saprospiraceae bacterium]
MGTETIYALNGVNLNIAPYEYLALMGPDRNPTLMNLLGCLDT